MKKFLMVYIFLSLVTIVNAYANSYEVLYDPNITWHSAKDDCSMRGDILQPLPAKRKTMRSPHCYRKLI